jgi:HD-GYP domain-containing protein (c-di-GMP phosphodiesterase class II)/DNA-binding CsgD family transcriptional regulator
VARARRDKAFDPRVVDAFVAQAGEWLGRRPASVWDDLLACEPAPVRRVADVGVAEVAQAFATYVDVKSPYTLGHSSAVARLAVAAARAAGIRGEAELEHLRIAALLHDLGFVSVPNGILEKPSALNAAEWERVRLHAYQTERVLSYAPCFRGFARLASSDHERLDGSGYPRGAAEAAGDRPAHLLAVADVLTALLEARAHRAAMTPDQAVKTLALEARRGTLDREAVDAVLAASGLGKSGAGADADGHGRGEPRLRGEGPSRLSERELEVLTLLARGLSNKQIGVELGISPKTAQHHVAHIYEKTGVSSRAAAATYAAVNELV